MKFTKIMDFINWKNEWKKRSELNNSIKKNKAKLMKLIQLLFQEII